MLAAPLQVSKCKSSKSSDSKFKAFVDKATDKTPNDCWNFCSPDLEEVESLILHGLLPLSSRSRRCGDFSDDILAVKWVCSPDMRTHAPANR